MKKLEKGFTLIELMIVVAIIAILAAVAAPKFGVQIKKAKDAKGLAVVGVLRSASTVQFADNDGVAVTSYVTLKTLIDDKSADLVTDTGSVTVGLNQGFASGTTGASATLIVLNTPSTSDGTISISTNNGTDAKGATWSAY